LTESNEQRSGKSVTPEQPVLYADKSDALDQITGAFRDPINKYIMMMQTVRFKMRVPRRWWLNPHLACKILSALISPPTLIEIAKHKFPIDSFTNKFPILPSKQQQDPVA
jgi:hypothetical protein